jgi:hypothetical protein
MVTRGFETNHVACGVRRCDDQDDISKSGTGSSAGSMALVTDRCELLVAVSLATSTF